MSLAFPRFLSPAPLIYVTSPLIVPSTPIVLGTDQFIGGALENELPLQSVDLGSRCCTTTKGRGSRVV
ncbi:hypothetical protein J6590_057390 [Homalodisca vitripennis]|nr:hypothetical protein J6590_057390 [Homalodisca vitripennis]